MANVMANVMKVWKEMFGLCWKRSMEMERQLLKTMADWNAVLSELVMVMNIEHWAAHHQKKVQFEPKERRVIVMERQ